MFSYISIRFFPLDDLKPWTKNHLGEYKRDGGTLKNTGVWTVSGDTLTITELPVGVWTEKIESQLKNPKSKLEFDKVEESHTDTTVQFVVKGVKDMKKMIGALKLTKTVRENYVVFMDNRIVETTLSSILHDHSTRRLELYKKRKAHQLNTIKKEEEEAEKKMKFIQKCIEGKIPLTTASNMDLIAACLEHSVDEKYLDINLRDLTKDKVTKLKQKIDQLKQTWKTLHGKSIQDIWLKELHDLRRIIQPANKKRTIIDLSD